MNAGEETVSAMFQTRGVYGCAFSPDGSFVVAAGGGGKLNVWEPTVEERETTLEGHMADVLDCAVGPDGSIVSASSGTVRIWDPTSSSPRLTLSSEGGVRNACCAVDPRGAQFVASIGGGPLELRDLNTGELRRTFIPSSIDNYRACTVGPDGSFIAAGGDASVIRIWDPASATEAARLEGHSDAIHDCAISPDGAFIVSASQDTTLRIWGVGTGLERGVLTGHSDMVMGCAVSPDSALVLSAGFDNRLKLWDAASCTEMTEFALTGRALCVAFHPTQPIAVCGDSKGALHRIELEGIGR
jgi:WD40 repeat protein